jgi:hypothetical protein
LVLNCRIVAEPTCQPLEAPLSHLPCRTPAPHTPPTAVGQAPLLLHCVAAPGPEHRPSPLPHHRAPLNGRPPCPTPPFFLPFRAVAPATPRYTPPRPFPSSSSVGHRRSRHRCRCPLLLARLVAGVTVMVDVQTARSSGRHHAGSSHATAPPLGAVTASWPGCCGPNPGWARQRPRGLGPKSAQDCSLVFLFLKSFFILNISRNLLNFNN